MRNIFSVCAAGIAMLSACGAPDQTTSGAPTSPPTVPAGLLAQPCPLPLAGDDAGPLSANVRVFIEIAAFDGNMAERIAKGPAIARSFTEWMNDPSSGVRRTAGMLATADTVTKMPLEVGAAGKRTSDGGAIRRWDLAITPHLGDPRSSELRMDLDLAPAPPVGPPQGSWSIPEHRRARTTVVLQDQTPVVIGLDPAVSGVEGRGWTLLMTPYVVRRDDDLRRLFECRTANRARVQR